MIIVVVVVFLFVGGAVTDVGGGEMRRESSEGKEKERRAEERSTLPIEGQFFILQQRYPPHWLPLSVPLSPPSVALVVHEATR